VSSLLFMQQSLRVVPSSSPVPTSLVSVKSTAGELSVHDALRHGPRSLATEVNELNPLQQRLDKWEETQDVLKLNLQRNLYGLHLPVRQLMERKIVSDGLPFNTSQRSNIHLDILMGRDEALDAADFFGDVDMSQPVDEHLSIERKRRL